MKLNKSQRYTAYCLILEEIQNREIDGICLIWENLCNDRTYGLGQVYHLGTALPELWSKKTKEVLTTTSSWFKDRKERIEALTQCINETHP